MRDSAVHASYNPRQGMTERTMAEQVTFVGVPAPTTPHSDKGDPGAATSAGDVRRVCRPPKTNALRRPDQPFEKQDWAGQAPQKNIDRKTLHVPCPRLRLYSSASALANSAGDAATAGLSRQASSAS